MDVGRLAGEADAAARMSADRTSARLDSLEQAVWEVRFRATDDADAFRLRAEAALGELESRLDEIERRIQERGDTVEDASRDVWARLTGELAELHARARTTADVSSERSTAAFDSARAEFAGSIAALSRELRRLTREIRPDSTGA
jgi:ElaB/YqjD/DUF883 family membrane-anchored ribosome-binding protein